MDKIENEQERIAMDSQASSRESCIPHFDALWYCYSKHTQICIQLLPLHAWSHHVLQLTCLYFYGSSHTCIHVQHPGINCDNTTDMAQSATAQSSGPRSWIA